ncbi:MAG: hypothetical protein KGM42_05840 [Hyphomicrobiales bacterium]|nr:hypothetical protein [Hyphomicrobiales bacterium]
MAVTGLVALSVAAGVAGARLMPGTEPVAASAPPQIEVAAVAPPQLAAPQPEPAAVEPAPLRTDTFGGLVRDAPMSAPFRPQLARAEAPTPAAIAPFAPVALTEQTPAGPVEIEVPLPPVRPAELGAPDMAFNAPLPPIRPHDLEEAPAAALPPVVVASLAPQAPVAAPETKPQLVEPSPQAVEQAAPPADVPFRKGQPAYVRIFKEEGQLELWLRKGAKFALYKTYPICKWSGHLGPKLREADYQSPEGFYSVSARQLNPNSHYHRAFNVGFPNALEKQLGYTGGLVMVHGDCQSVGCFAMTDRGIDEIYGFVAAAIAGGQKEVPVNIFPFRMTDSKFARETGAGLLSFAPAGNERWSSFWSNLKEGYDLFEKSGEPPVAYACGGHYGFNVNGAACKRIAGW